MIATVIISGITCLTMILSSLFFPQVRLKNFKIDLYWIIVLIGALIIVLFGFIDIKFLFNELIKDSSINPIKILILFISMTILSIFLDEVGFFKYLASKAIKFAKNSQTKLFIVLYVTVSILTIFTSNDIIVLTFTPFICYFAKNTKINPLPYLVGEFIAANTMSMMFIIGNPTNIYIATSYGISFLEYLKVMFFPTIVSAAVALAILYLIFRKQLKAKVENESEEVKIKSKPLLIIGLIHLGVSTVLLAIGSYIGLEMWIVAFIAVLSLFLFALAISFHRKQRPTEVICSLKRAPWQLIPFVISMFTLILAIKGCGVTEIVCDCLGNDLTIFKYGISSFLAANVINNIPMSVLFSAIIEPLSGITQLRAVYATIVGSNLGAFLTPIGALAGIMWTSLLKDQGIYFSFGNFVKYGIIVSIPTLVMNLLTLTMIV